MIKNVVFSCLFFLVAPSLIYIMHFYSTRDLMTEEEALAAKKAYYKCVNEEYRDIAKHRNSKEKRHVNARIMEQLVEEYPGSSQHPIVEKCSKLTGWNWNE